MATLIGGNARLIEPDELTQEQCDELLEGVMAEPPSKISHSLERLSHFRCGVCQGWWSVGDWHVRAKDRRHMYCTWCGTLQEVAQ